MRMNQLVLAAIDPADSKPNSCNCIPCHDVNDDGPHSRGLVIGFLDFSECVSTSLRRHQGRYAFVFKGPLKEHLVGGTVDRLCR